MSWKVRHEGSPRAVEGLTLPQVAQGLLDGQWEPTDEVMGPDDQHWVAMENHPQLEEVAAEVEPPPQKSFDDETRLDMTALIDVCLVLLVFFILTTTYAALQRMIEAPDMTAQKLTGAPRKVTPDQVKEFMVKVDVRMQREGSGADEKDVPVIRVEGETVPRDQLLAELSRFHSNTRKTEVLIDHSPRVPYGTIIAIQDAAKGAGYDKVHVLIPPEELENVK
jgi:biopolymer transport protein ExbD